MDDRTRINVRTSDEIDTWLYALEKSCYRGGIRFRGKKATKEAIVNALIAAMMKSEPAKTLEVIRNGVETYEKQVGEIASAKP